jgi:hypothetical protein
MYDSSRRRTFYEIDAVEALLDVAQEQPSSPEGVRAMSAMEKVLRLVPALEATMIVADRNSCRQQLQYFAREARPVARVCT